MYSATSKPACVRAKIKGGANLDVGLAAALGSALSAPMLLPESKRTNVLNKCDLLCTLGAVMIPWRRVDADG